MGCVKLSLVVVGGQGSCGLGDPTSNPVSRAIIFNIACPVGFWTHLDLLLLSSFLLSSFGKGMYILYLAHHCILEVHYLFGLTGSQLKSNVPQNES